MSRRTKQRKRFRENIEAQNEATGRYLLSFKNAIEVFIDSCDLPESTKDYHKKRLNNCDKG